ncbi:MAG TPA: TRAP transporter large permease [Nitrospira sp.]|nr:TRAP transporter large permease [Nitrospira sp.]
MGIASTALVIAFCAFMAVGVPIAFVLGGAALVGLFFAPNGLELLPSLPQQIYDALSSFNFLAIPLFIFAGALLSEGGVAKNLMELASRTIGRGRGGLGVSVIGSTMLFSGISGSSSADTAAISKVANPTLKEQGYPAPFRAALLASSGCAGTLIPPTNDLILIGIVGNMSIAGLFAAGIFPAIVNGLGLMAWAVYVSRRNGYGNVSIPFSLKAILWSFVKAGPAILLILIILGGILGGVFTPTEAASVAVVYGFFLAAFVYRTLTFNRLVAILRNTIEISGMVLLVIAMCAILGYVLTIFQVPGMLGKLLDAWAPDRFLFLLLVQVLFFIIGIVMDTVPAILILVPMLTPMAVARGIEPIHFGILIECNIALGFITPPIGNVLFTACAVVGVSLERVVKPLLPMIAVLTVTMLIITYVEGVSMFLPRLLKLVD